MMLFTPRQALVAAGIRQGKTNKQIGKEIGITEKSVKGHVTAILYVLGCTNRTEAAIILLSGHATKTGWVIDSLHQ